ncbi:MAG: formate/nitrite transporter family protein [Clostridia bacterium]|nr:formate/nitrite transporter family protein [Clostridia bacterium]
MLKTLGRVFSLGIAAGIMIGIGGCVYLACLDGSFFGKCVGAFMFGVALLSICTCGMYLYTGRICYLYENHDMTGVLSLIIGILGNAVGAVAVGQLTRIALPAVAERAQPLAVAKLGENWYTALILGVLCNILIYVAVQVYKARGTVVGIMICIPTFVLCGFEHSIADMYYLSAANSFSLNALIFILIVIVGNTVGGLLMPGLLKLGGLNNDKK